MEAHDVMKAMKQRANELGWAVETNWKDTNDGTAEYDVYLWQVSGVEPRTSDLPYACPDCKARYHTPEHAAGCAHDHDPQREGAEERSDDTKSSKIIEVG